MGVRRMRLAAVVAVFGLVSLPSQAKQLSVKDVLAMQASVQSGEFAGRAQWQALGFYLQGVIEGIAAQQLALQAAGKPGLFCPPKGKGYSMQEFFRLLHQSDAEQRDKPVSEVLFASYATLYPCD